MPAYQASPVGRNVIQAVPGLPAYAFGSLNRIVAPTRMHITAGSVTGNVATITGTVIEGNIPTVGQLVTVAGCSNSTFNVTNIAIATVSAAATPDVGVYTITYALTTGDIASGALTGLAMAPQIEVGETLANQSSIAIALQSNVGPNNAQTVRFDVTFPTIPTTAQVDVYTAAIDVDSEYVLLTTVANVAASTVTGQSAVWPDLRANFVRFKVSTLAGSGKIIAKVLV